MKIPSSQRQPLNKTNGGGGVMEETSFSGQTEWEGLHSVGWRGMRIAVSLPINTRVSYGLTWKMLSISVLVFSQVDCKGYCLCSGLHSIKGSCLQSRFFFSLLRIFVYINFAPKLLLWDCRTKYASSQRGFIWTVKF